MNLRRSICIATGVFLGTAPLGWTAEPWIELPSLPEGLAGFAVRNFDGNIQIAGGTNWKDGNKTWSDRILELAEHGRQWRIVGDLPFPLAYGGSMAAEEGWWLLGGHNVREASGDAVCLDDVGRVVRRLELSTRWRFARGAALGGIGYFVVRQEAAGGEWVGVFMEVSPGTGAAHVLAPLPNAAWVVPAISSANERIVVAGGASYDPASGQLENRAELLIYDPIDRRWTQWGVLPKAVRGMAAVALDSQRIFLAGGFSADGHFEADAYVLNLVAGRLARTWSLPIGCMPELVRAGDWIYSIGGEDDHRSRSCRVFKIPVRSLIDEAEMNSANHETRDPQ